MTSTAARSLSLAALFSLFIVRPVSAHALGADCTLRNGKVEIEAFFSDDTPARDAHVVVQDASQKIVIEGRTDANGCWSFPAPPAGTYQVIVNASAGHQTRVRLVIPQTPAIVTASAGNLPKQVTADVETTSSSISVSEGPSRQEFTRFPWLRAAIGLAGIAGLAASARLLLRRFRTQPVVLTDGEFASRTLP